MMKLKKFTLFFAAFSLLWAGCKDDKSEPVPADADDNFITSVVLTVGDKSYAADIVDNDITITVPYTVSLDGATPDFSYTASAKIMPDPATITNWNTERQFRVTSYTGKTNDYTYRVVKDEIREEGDVVLKTDAEVKAFADRGVTILKGNLTIGEAEGDNRVTNIGALTMLKEIEGRVTVNNTYAGQDLAGLDQVTKIGGLSIGTAENASAAGSLYFANLASLEEVTGDIIICNDSVQWFDAKKLVRTGGSIVIKSQALTSITLPVLQEVGAGLEIQGSNNGKAGSTMTEVSFPELLTVGGDVLIQNLAKLNAVKFKKLAKAGAFLLPTIPYTFETIELPALSEVGGDIQFISNVDPGTIGGATMNTGIRTIDMNALTAVDGTLEISSLTALESLPGFRNLTSLKGLNLVQLGKLSGEIDLSSVTFTGGAIILGSLNKVTRVIGARTVDADIRLSVWSDMRYEGFETVNSLDIQSTEELSFPVKSIKNNLDCRINADVTFPLLEEVGGSVTRHIGSSGNLVIPNLIRVGGTLDAPAASYLHLVEVGEDLLVNGAYCPKIQKVNGNVGTAECPELIEIGGNCGKVTDAKKLRKVGGRMSDSDGSLYPVLEEVGTAPSFEGEYGLKLYINGSKEIVGQYPALKKVGKGLLIQSSLWGNIDDYGGMTTTVSMPVLETVDGPVRIEITDEGDPDTDSDVDDVLTTLLFPELKSVRSVSINGFALLKDFSAFRHVIPALSGQTWSVTGCGYNPTWDQMKAGKYSE